MGQGWCGRTLDPKWKVKDQPGTSQSHKRGSPSSGESVFVTLQASFSLTSVRAPMCTRHKATSQRNTLMGALQTTMMWARRQVRPVLLKARPRKWTPAETSSGVAVALPRIGQPTHAPSHNASHQRDTPHLAHSG
jgi:hypothetical protein